MRGAGRPCAENARAAPLLGKRGACWSAIRGIEGAPQPKGSAALPCKRLRFPEARCELALRYERFCGCHRYPSDGGTAGVIAQQAKEGSLQPPADTPGLSPPCGLLLLLQSSHRLATTSMRPSPVVLQHRGRLRGGPAAATAAAALGGRRLRAPQNGSRWTCAQWLESRWVWCEMEGVMRQVCD